MVGLLGAFLSDDSVQIEARCKALTFIDVLCFSGWIGKKRVGAGLKPFQAPHPLLWAYLGGNYLIEANAGWAVGSSGS